MRSKRHFELGVILSVLFLTILSLELGNLEYRSASIFGQESFKKMALVRLQDTIHIEQGRFLVLVDKMTNQVLARGEFSKLTNTDSTVGFTIWLKSNGSITQTPINKIGVLYTGNGRNLGPSVLSSGLMGLGLGALAGVIIVATDPCIGPEIIPFTTGVGGGAFAIGGAIKGSIDSFRAKSYQIRPNDWQIISNT